MELKIFCNILAIIAFSCTECVKSDRMTTKIYEYLQADYFCFRLLNATHQIGCSSIATGNVGVVHVVESSEDMEWILQEGPDPPYIAALSYEFFNFQNMTELKNSDRVTGVLVLQGNVTMTGEGYSPETECPNDNFGLYGFYSQENKEYASCVKGKWNPSNPASTMLFHDWKMPIFLVTREENIQSIVQGCYKRFNAPVNGTARPWPLCSAELGSFMLGAKDSPTCIRRSSMHTNLNPAVKLCDPLGSRNLINTLLLTNKDKPLDPRSVIVLAARLDSASMFDNIAPGADSAVTGLVTLLSVAHTLFQVKDKFSHTDKNVLFTIFNGESFDYIGSSRMVFDMEREEFPAKLEDGIQQPALIGLRHISHFIELNQVGPQIGELNNYWIHTDPLSTKSTEVNITVNTVAEYLRSYLPTLSRTDSNHPLPPASAQRFLLKDLKIPAVVITNYDKAYKNKHYNSRFDLREDLHNGWEAHLQNLSTGISKTIYRLLTGEEPPQLPINATLISDIMECYLTNAFCELFQAIASPSKVKQRSSNRTEPIPLYVSVDNQGSVNPITLYTRHLLAYLMGDKLTGYTESNCTVNNTDHIFEYDWMVGNLSNPGVCVQSTTRYTMAQSPAAVLDDWTSNEYSTWTESVWQTSSLRIFLKPSRQLEGLTLGIGCVIFALSLLIVYSANKRADLLFGSRALVGC